MAGNGAVAKKGLKRLGLSRKSVQTRSEKVPDDSPAAGDLKGVKNVIPSSQTSSKEDFKPAKSKHVLKTEDSEERRDSNWEDDEISTLICGVKDNWAVITSEHRGVGSKAMTEKAKNDAWETITEAVNA